MGGLRHVPGMVLIMRFLLPFIMALTACNLDPSDQMQEQVGYRTGTDGGPNSGERGNVKISEVMWPGSVRAMEDGSFRWDPTDIFIEIRNEGDRPMNLSGWQLQVQGTADVTFILPDHDTPLDVGQHAFVAAQDRDSATGDQNGCFTGATWLLPELRLPQGDPFRVTLRDKDERLIESAGDRMMPPFAGTYDLHSVRSMEKIELMFGGRGNEPQSWHHYTDAEVDVPNNDRVRGDCQARTLASPGRPNSPDYSGAFTSGSFE